MKVGKVFTYNGRRYEIGDAFPVDRLPEWQRDSFVRLYHLTDEPVVVNLAAMKKSDLVALADEQGIDLPAGATKSEIIDTIKEV